MANEVKRGERNGLGRRENRKRKIREEGELSKKIREEGEMAKKIREVGENLGKK